jgi:uncharacterized membrane-anchored protein
MEENQTMEQEEKALSPEEYAAARNKAIAHLKEEIKYLKVEKEYETLMADVEEAKTRRITMVAQQARFFTPQNKEGGEEQPAPPTPKEPRKRKLKQD